MGDTCRSPLAKGILRREFQAHHIEGEVDSAGFEPHHIGHSVNKRTKKVAEAHGIDLSDHKTRMFDPKDFERFDRIYVMDQRDYRDVRYASGASQEHMEKVDFMMNLIDEEKKNKIIPDPLYKGYRSFETIYSKLERACKALVKQINEA